MPASLVAHYIEQMNGIRAEEKLREVECILVANADKKADRDKVMNQWRREAERGMEKRPSGKQKPPDGIGMKYA
jgi:hypothetical protein